MKAKHNADAEVAAALRIIATEVDRLLRVCDAGSNRAEPLPPVGPSAERELVKRGAGDEYSDPDFVARLARRGEIATQFLAERGEEEVLFGLVSGRSAEITWLLVKFQEWLDATGVRS